MKDQTNEGSNNWDPMWWAFLSVKEALSEFRESRFLISTLNTLHWSHSRGRFELRCNLIFPFSIYNSTSSLSWMPSLFLNFLFPSITNISSWIYFGSISQKSKVPLLLGVAGGHKRAEREQQSPLKCTGSGLGSPTCQGTLSIAPTPSSAVHVLWVQSSMK